MSRDKQIEEMARNIASTPIGTVKPDLTLTEMGEVYKGAFINRIAKHLYSEGYRKGSEVAREIFEEIEEFLKQTCEKGYVGSISSLLVELRKKYTESENDNE